MKRRVSNPIGSLAREVASPSADDIDRLYGLEPVYEPALSSGGCEPEEIVAFRCPHCGERLQTRVDMSEGERRYIEDCEVCCRPIELAVELDERGGLVAVGVQRLD